MPISPISSGGGAQLTTGSFQAVVTDGVASSAAFTMLYTLLLQSGVALVNLYRAVGVTIFSSGNGILNVTGLPAALQPTTANRRCAPVSINFDGQARIGFIDMSVGSGTMSIGAYTISAAAVPNFPVFTSLSALTDNPLNTKGLGNLFTASYYL